MVVTGGADQHQIADIRIIAQSGVAKAEQPAETPAMQAELLLPTVLAHLYQHLGQVVGKVAAQAQVVVIFTRAPPVHHVQLKTAGAQVAHQAALREQIIDQHVHRQRRDQHQRGALGVFADGHYRSVTERNGFFLQWRVVAQLDQTIVEQGVVRGLFCLAQALCVEQASTAIVQAVKPWAGFLLQGVSEHAMHRRCDSGRPL